MIGQAVSKAAAVFVENWQGAAAASRARRQAAGDQTPTYQYPYQFGDDRSQNNVEAEVNAAVAEFKERIQALDRQAMAAAEARSKESLAWAAKVEAQVARAAGYPTDFPGDARIKRVGPILDNLPSGGPPEDEFLEEGKPPLFYGVDPRTGYLLENPLPNAGVYKSDGYTFYAERTSLSAAEQEQLRRDNELFWKRKQNESNSQWNAAVAAEKEWKEYRDAGVVSWAQKPSNLGSVDEWKRIKGQIDAKTREELNGTKRRKR